MPYWLLWGEFVFAPVSLGRARPRGHGGVGGFGDSRGSGFRLEPPVVSPNELIRRDYMH